MGIITLDMYCFISYFGVESGLLLSFFRLCLKPMRRGSWGSISRIVPSGRFLSSYIYHLFIISKQKTYHTFVSYGFLVLNPRLSSLGGIVALGKFDALHIDHRELAIQATKVGPPFLLSVVGMAEVLGWESRYGCYISLLFIYLNSSFPIFMQSLSIASILCLLGSHCQGTKNWICIMTDVKMVEGWLFA